MFIFTGTTASFQSSKGFLTVNEDHPKFYDIVQLCNAKDYEGAAALYDVKEAIKGLLSGSDVSLVGSTLVYEGEKVRGLLGERIIKMNHVGLSVGPLIAFLDNLKSNPSSRAQEELYSFLEVSKLPITEDGCFLAYKSVRSDYTDKHSGTIRNAVGDVITMVRNKVDEDKDRTCSYGLHFAAHEYAEGFGSGDDRMMVMKINPRDVVAIPSDYQNQKGRCCEYEVIEEVSRGDKKLVGAEVVNLGSVAAPEVSKVTTYVPQSDNYNMSSIWYVDAFDGGYEFIEEAAEFPVNRKTTYDLHRISNGKQYEDFFFVNYKVEHDNLVFRKFNGVDFDYVTVADVDDWEIRTVAIVHSDMDD